MADYSEDMYDYDDLENYNPPSPFHTSKGLITSCSAPDCKRKENLSRCGACKVVSYCCREHQVADRPHHKTFCTPVKKAQAKLDKEETALRAHPGSFIMPANPFESCVGRFWGILDTRDYMRARYGVVDTLLKINTRLAVNAALDHIMDMFRLCRGDNMGLRAIAPALLLRLGRDQECYDFVKWWGTIAQSGDYFWEDVEGPYLNLKGEDVFEPVDFLVGKYPDISHVLAITLLKIRLLIDLQSLQRATQEVGPHVPQEVLDSILQHSVSSVVRSNREMLEREDRTLHIKELGKQIKQLFECVKEANKYMWPAILKPGNNATARPGYTSAGSPREMQLQLQYCYNAWAETPGAIEVIEVIQRAV